MVRRLAAALAALALMLLLAGPAFATTQITNPLPVKSSDPLYQGTQAQCAEFNVQPGQVVWHFTAHSSTNTDLLTATFLTFGTTTVSPYKVTDTYELQFAITTGSPDTLQSASTTATDNLQLSHICDGGPPPDVPEAPASVLLLLTAGLLGLGFVGWRMRRSTGTA
jgi:hypothetical protein